MYFHKIYSKGNGTEVKTSVPFLIILQDFHYYITRITTNQNELKQRSSRCVVCERKLFRIPCTIICPCHNDTRRIVWLRKFNFSSVAARKIQIVNHCIITKQQPTSIEGRNTRIIHLLCTNAINARGWIRRTLWIFSLIERFPIANLISRK